MNNYEYFRREAMRIIKKYGIYENLYPHNWWSILMIRLRVKEQLTWTVWIKKIILPTNTNGNLLFKNVTSDEAEGDKPILSLSTGTSIANEPDKLNSIITSSTIISNVPLTSISLFIDFSKLLFFIELFILTSDDNTTLSDNHKIGEWSHNILEDTEDSHDLTLKVLSQQLNIQFVRRVWKIWKVKHVDHGAKEFFRDCSGKKKYNVKTTIWQC